jgi:hypothetical protein
MNLLFWSISSTYGWFYLYKFLKSIFNNKNLEYISRIYSNLHAVFIIYGSLLHLKYGGNIIDKFSSITCGYAVFDIFRALKKKEYDYIVHHSLIIISNIPFILEQYNFIVLPFFYRQFISLNYLSEISTIFLNICWLLLKNNKKNTFLFKSNAILTLICFFIFRILNFTYILANLYNYNCLFTLQLVLTSLNYHWFYKLVKKYFEINVNRNI